LSLKKNKTRIKNNQSNNINLKNRIFLAFSNFAEMHSIMSNYRIGILTMKAIEFELKRLEIRQNEQLAREQQQTMEIQQFKQQHQIQNHHQTEYLQFIEKLKKQREKEIYKEQQFAYKQDKLFFVGFYILLNLAEDVIVERKMMKKGLLNMLLSLLQQRSFEDLLILIVTFLKKLSMFEENKNLMKEQNVIEIVSKILTCSSQPLINITLRLLFNLSFDRVNYYYHIIIILLLLLL
jgi:hypothetical protein